MPLSLDQIVAIIDTELESYAKSELSSIAQVRRTRLEVIRNFLNTNGFPRSLREKFELSLHPFYFQEVNYDDLDPYSKNGELGHLKNAYTIDLAVQTGGSTREQISDADLYKYLKIQSRVIDWRQGHPRFSDRALLLISRMRRS